MLCIGRIFQSLFFYSVGFFIFLASFFLTPVTAYKDLAVDQRPRSLLFSLSTSPFLVQVWRNPPMNVHEYLSNYDFWSTVSEGNVLHLFALDQCFCLMFFFFLNSALKSLILKLCFYLLKLFSYCFIYFSWCSFLKAVILCCP